MKKTMIALVATIMAGACVFFACSKKEENEKRNNEKRNNEKRLFETEFESIGMEHNAILTELGFAMLDELDDCANRMNEHAFSPDGADQLVASMQNKLREISFKRYETVFSDDEWIILTSRIDHTLSDEFSEQEFIGSKFESIVSELLQDPNIKNHTT